jgi:CCR4-NOT transcription complex subunit 1
LFGLELHRREKAIFSCMVQSLFDEYRFFPRYPERELRITAVLFGMDLLFIDS